MIADKASTHARATPRIVQLGAAVTEAFLLKEAARRSKALPGPLSRDVHKIWNAVGERVAFARLADEDSGALAVALTPLREAAQLQVRAIAMIHNMAPPGDRWDDVRSALIQTWRNTISEAEAQRAADAVSPRDPIEAAELSVDALRDMHEAAVGAIESTRRVHMVPSMGQVWFQRVLRLGMIALIVGAGVWWGIDKVRLRLFDLAYLKPVTTSSLHSQSPPTGVTNGQFESTYGLITGVDTPAWVEVDLGRICNIRDVVVSSRGDAYAMEGVTYVLELSEDGAHWAALDKHSATFRVWKSATKAPTRARYVRVRTEGTGQIGLDEIEVH